MGVLRIDINGSFGNDSQSFAALRGGHADAIGRAIEYLSGELMPKAIRQDHKLHDDGERPPERDFGLGKT